MSDKGKIRGETNRKWKWESSIATKASRNYLLLLLFLQLSTFDKQKNRKYMNWKYIDFKRMNWPNIFFQKGPTFWLIWFNCSGETNRSQITPLKTMHHKCIYNKLITETQIGPRFGTVVRQRAVLSNESRHCLYFCQEFECVLFTQQLLVCMWRILE